MNYEVKEQLYEGKAKQVFATNDPEIVMVHYKDDATAGDGEKKGTIRDKGIVNNRSSRRRGSRPITCRRSMTARPL